MRKESDNIAVSVICYSYNQADYIAHTIDSFLMQETDFDFEIFVSDDASTDGTDKIIAEYAERFPGKVIAVLHEINEYSRGINLAEAQVAGMARGKYVAYCDGDDYWTSPHKLQAQYDAMEAAPNAVFCVHASENVNADTMAVLSVNKPFNSACTAPYKYLLTHVHPFATNSYFFPLDLYKRYIESEFLMMPAHGDHKMSLFMASFGETVYLPEVMSAYRVLAKNSANSRIISDPKHEQLMEEIRDRRIELLHKIDEMTNHEYSSDVALGIQAMKDDHEYYIAMQRKDVPLLKSAVHRQRFASESMQTRLKVHLGHAFPKLYARLKDVSRS